MELTRRDRDLAIQSGNMKEANALNDKLSDLALSLQKIRKDLEQRDIENLYRGREVGAKERSAEAEVMAAQTRAEPPVKPVSRTQILEQYADNWEKLDILQKNALKKQNINTFEDYVAYRDRIAGTGGATSSTAPAGVARPTTQAEFDALPKEAQFINPADGRLMTKN